MKTKNGFSLKILLLYALIFLINGCCKTCLNQTKSKIDYPVKARTGTKYVDSQLDLSRVAWWKKLHDPQLNQLLVKALANNNQIKSANATILQAQAQLKAAQYAWIPTLDASANGFTGSTWNFNNTPKGAVANSPLFTNLNNFRFNGYYTGFVPGYSVNILNNIYAVNSAKASLAIEQAQAQATRLSIISQMSGAYFMLLSQKQQLQVEQNLVKDLKKMQQLEKVRYQDGASDIETVTSMEQQIAEEEIKLPQIKKVLEQTENTMRLLMNQNPAAIATHSSLLNLQTHDLIPKNIPSSVLQNRPDIIVAINNVKLAFAQAGIAYSAYFPTISLTGLLGSASVDLTNLLRISTNLWVAQAYAAMKIVNLSSYQQIKAAKAGFFAIYQSYIETLRTVFKDVDDSLTNERQNRLSYLQAEKAYKAAKSTYSIALTQYQKGARDYRTVVNAKVNLDKSLLNLIQQKAQLLDSIVQMYIALGGGYNVDVG